MWEISNVGPGASVEMVDAQEVSEGNELNTSGEYTKWPPVAGVTTDATKQLGRREPSPKLQKKSKPQAVSSFQELGTQTLSFPKDPNGQTNDLVNFVRR